MQYSLKPGEASNFIISLTVNNEDTQHYRKKALQEFQKSILENENLHLELDDVAEKVKPQYLEIATMEEAIHAGTRQLLEENDEIKFIGQIYDLEKNDLEDGTQFIFKLDVYPEVVISSDEWRSIKWEPIPPEELAPTQEEIEQTFQNLRRQYANNEQAELVTDNCEFSLLVELVNENRTAIATHSHYIVTDDLPPEQWAGMNFLIGCKQDTPLSLQRQAVDDNVFNFLLPGMEDAPKEDYQVRFSVFNLVQTKLPEFNARNINRMFGSDEVNSEAELREKIGELIKGQKKEVLLMRWVDQQLSLLEPYFRITIPRTLVNEEFNTRIQSLAQRMGVKTEKEVQENLKEKWSEMKPQVEAAARGSLQKFFILRKLVEQLGIDGVNWEKSMDVEGKLYARLTGL